MRYIKFDNLINIDGSPIVIEVSDNVGESAEFDSMLSNVSEKAKREAENFKHLLRLGV